MLTKDSSRDFAEDQLDHSFQSHNPVKTLLSLYKGDRVNLALAAFFYVLKYSPVWAIPLVMAAIVNIVASPKKYPISILFVYAIILFIVVIQNIPTHYLYMRFLSKATRRVERNLRTAISWRLHHLSMQFYAKKDSGTLQTKLIRDVEMIEQVTKQLCDTIPGSCIAIVVAVTTTALYVPQFLLFFMVSIPIAVMVFRRLNKPMRKRNQAFREEIEHVSAHMIEMVHLIPVTRAHSAEKNELERLQIQLAQMKFAGEQLDKTTAIFGSVTWVVLRLFDTTCLIVAGYCAYTQVIPMNVGDVILLTGFFQSITNSILSITNIFPQLAKGFESISSIREIFADSEIEDNEGKRALKTTYGHFTFQNVSFSYTEDAEPSLNDISLEVFPGETIALVGPSGAGKSTMINMIIGFLKPTHGRILLDGQDMQEINLKSYRHFLSTVTQETILFHGTIRENIIYGLKNIDEQRFQQVLIDANVKEFIDNLPDGVETMIGENGARLSGGQRQRIAIARALIRNPRILILDEATSALDMASEVLIQEALERLMKNRTTLVVAHRLSTIRNADRIVVLENGHIIELGSHEELLRQAGTYAQLNALSTR